MQGAPGGGDRWRDPAISQLRSLLAFDEDAAAEYAEMLTERAGLPVSMADASIAAICRVHRAVCATRNTKDFAQTSVELIDPWAES